MKNETVLQYESGDKYSRLMLTGKAYHNEKSRRFMECICDCGNKVWKDIQNLRIGHIKSCGCINRKHGMTVRGVKLHPIYKAWMNMKNRCYQKSLKGYPNYGGRGITVCVEWFNGFIAFYKWAIENNWRSGLSLEREDNDKGYSPDNCIWGTLAIQSRNKRTNNIIEAFGEKKCCLDWANDKRCVVTYYSINHRMKKYGWSAEKAITEPKVKHNKYNSYKKHNDSTN